MKGNKGERKEGKVDEASRPGVKWGQTRCRVWPKCHPAVDATSGSLTVDPESRSSKSL